MSNLRKEQFTEDEKELINKMVMLVLKVQEKGDFCSIELANFGVPIVVHYMRGDWDKDKEYTTFDCCANLLKTFTDYANECISFLESVLNDN